MLARTHTHTHTHTHTIHDNSLYPHGTKVACFVVCLPQTHRSWVLLASLQTVMQSCFSDFLYNTAEGHPEDEQ